MTIYAESGALRSRLFVTSAMGACLIAPAFAQTEANPDKRDDFILVADAIVVTAQKRQSTLFDTAAPISAITGDVIVDRGVVAVNDLVNQIPGFALNADFGGSANTKISIRGIGGTDETRPNGSASVAFHVDNVFQANTLFLTAPLFDVERVEVLKGPQGTLYGRNSTAGAVNIITRDPGEDSNGYLRAEAAEFGRYYVEGAVGGEVADGFGLRLAVAYENGGGFMQGLGAGAFAGFTTAPGVIPGVEDPGARDGFGDRDVLSIRGTAKWDWADLGVLRIKAAVVRDWSEPQYLDSLAESIIVDGAVVTDTDPFTFATEQYTENDIDLYSISADYNVALAENLNLDLIAGYQSGERQLFGNGFSAPLRIFNFDFEDEFDQITVEARISDDKGGTFDWMIGGFYLTDTVDFDTLFFAEDIVNSQITSQYAQERTSYAVFGQVDIPITERFILSGGLRGTFDEAEFEGVTSDINPFGVANFGVFIDEVVVDTTSGETSVVFTDGLLFSTTPDGRTIAELPFSTDQDDEDLSGRITAQYYFTDDLNAYASYGTGYKAGGFDGSTIFALIEAEPFDAETVTAYEAGIKWFPSSGRFNLTLDGFFYDFEQLQGTAADESGANLRFNIAAAELYGAEIALNANVLSVGAHELDVYFGASFIESEVVELDERAVAGIEVGAQLPAAPEFTANWAATYSYQMTTDWLFAATLDGRRTSEDFKRLTNEGPSLIDGYTVLNARLELEHAKGYAVYVFGRNITDKTYFLDAAGSTRLVAAPSVFGGGVSWSF